MPDFFGGTSGFKSAPGVAVNSAFELAADSDGQFDQCAGALIERSCLGGGGAQGVIGLEHLRILFLELEVAGRKFFGAGSA